MIHPASLLCRTSNPNRAIFRRLSAGLLLCPLACAPLPEQEAPGPQGSPYPTPSFAATGSPTPKAPKPKASPDGCTEQSRRQVEWHQVVGPWKQSPRDILASFHASVKSPLRWIGQSSGQTPDSYLQMRLATQGFDPRAKPIFVSRIPSPQNSPSTPSAKQDIHCNSYLELPVSIDLSSGDQKLELRSIPATIFASVPGLGTLRASLPPAIPLDIGAAPAQDNPDDSSASAPANTNSAAPSPKQNLDLRAYLAPGIFWAEILQLTNQGERLLGDANFSYSRCKDGRSLRLSLDHNIGGASTRALRRALQQGPDLQLQWEGQKTQTLALASVSVPQETCTNVDLKGIPDGGLNFSAQFIWRDPQGDRALILQPQLRAHKDPSDPQKWALRAHSSAFSRPGEGWPSFLVRHTLPNLIPPAGFELFECRSELQWSPQEGWKGQLEVRGYQTQDSCQDREKNVQKDACQTLGAARIHFAHISSPISPVIQNAK